VTIGRENDNSLVIKDERVSRYHAEIRVFDGIYILNDLKSRNGTFVNQERIETPREIHASDMLLFGKTTFRFVLETVTQPEQLGKIPAPPEAGQIQPPAALGSEATPRLGDYGQQLAPASFEANRADFGFNPDSGSPGTFSAPPDPLNDPNGPTAVRPASLPAAAAGAGVSGMLWSEPAAASSFSPANAEPEQPAQSSRITWILTALTLLFACSAFLICGIAAVIFIQSH
jgi:predicted component of type VI protein secretion system